MESIWSKTARMPEFAPLEESIRTDVLIIGGGLTGILCARMLSEAGVDCALVEADRLCGGVTGNTTAKITLQHGLIYHKMIQKFGLDFARLYWDANQAALKRYRTLCGEIDCDFEEQENYVYSTTDRTKLEKEWKALRAIGVDADLVTDLPLPVTTVGAVKVRRQAQFHPLKFAAAATEGLQIFEHTKVQELKPGRAVTENGTIAAEKIIIATHFPVLNKHGGYFLKLYQHRSYVLALENAPVTDGMYVDESKTGLSFRRYGNRLLLGGGVHRTGKQGGGWRELEEFARAHYPKAQIVSRWATQDCMTLDDVPYIGMYCEQTPDLYVATGFNKWGMTSAMVAAELLTDLIQEKENPYAKVFSPSRTVMRAQLAVNAVETVVNLLTPTVPRCPHMGCALKYNRQEHTWDCPCHGSRFAEDGSLIDNPATDDKKLK